MEFDDVINSGKSVARWRDKTMDEFELVIVGPEEQSAIKKNVAVETALLHVEQALVAIFTGEDPYPEDNEALPSSVVNDMASRVRELLGDRINRMNKDDMVALLLVIFATRKDLLDKRFALARGETEVEDDEDETEEG